MAHAESRICAEAAYGKEMIYHGSLLAGITTITLRRGFPGMSEFY